MKLLYSLVAVLATSAASALAQQQYGDVGPGQFRTDIIVDLATNPAIREELDISEEVAGKLAALRDEYRAAVQKGYQDAGVNPALNPLEMTIQQRRMYREIAQKLNDEFVPKVTALLTPAQNKRLGQIQLQGKFRYIVPAVLRGLEELKLTDDQKQKLSALTGELVPGGVITQDIHAGLAAKAMEVLTAEQKEALNLLKGEEFDLTRLVPRTPRVLRPRIAPPGKGNNKP